MVKDADALMVAKRWASATGFRATSGRSRDHGKAPSVGSLLRWRAHRGAGRVRPRERTERDVRFRPRRWRAVDFAEVTGTAAQAVCAQRDNRTATCKAARRLSWAACCSPKQVTPNDETGSGRCGWGSVAMDEGSVQPHHVRFLRRVDLGSARDRELTGPGAVRSQRRRMAGPLGCRAVEHASDWLVPGACQSPRLFAEQFAEAQGLLPWNLRRRLEGAPPIRRAGSVVPIDYAARCPIRPWFIRRARTGRAGGLTARGRCR